MRSTIRLFAILFCGFGVLAALNWGFGWFEADDVRRLLDSASAHPWRVGLFVIVLLAFDSVLSVPTMGTAAVAGHLLGPWWGGLCASIGVLAAGSICFGVASLFRRRAVLEKVRREVREVGPRPLLLARAIPMLPEVLSAMAGATGMRYRRYLFWFALGNIPFLTAASFAGSVSGVDRPWPALATAIGLPVLAGLAYVVARAYSMMSWRTPK